MLLSLLDSYLDPDVTIRITSLMVAVTPFGRILFFGNNLPCHQKRSPTVSSSRYRAMQDERSLPIALESCDMEETATVSAPERKVIDCKRRSRIAPVPNYR